MPAEKHSATWCRENPQQAAADIDRMHMGITEALRLIRTGDAMTRPPEVLEAVVWLHNASQI